MNKDQLTEWFSEKFWAKYLTLVKTPFPTKYKAGNRGSALKKVLTLNPSEELRERILGALDAQIKHRIDLIRSLGGSMEAYTRTTDRNKFYCNRHGETWLNQMGWEDDIPSISEEKSTTYQTQLCGCGQPTLGPQIKYCTKCYPNTTGTDLHLKGWLKTNNLWKTKEETTEQWRERCRAFLVNNPMEIG